MRMDTSERCWDFMKWGFKENEGVRGKTKTREFLPLLRTLRDRILDGKS